MWPVLVVVAAVDAEYVCKVAAADDEDPVEAVGANRAHPALGEGVRVRGLDRCADHLDAFGPEDLVEGAAELRVRSWIRNRHGCSPPSCMARLRACWVTQRPSGFELQAMYSIRRAASEMKNRT